MSEANEAAEATAGATAETVDVPVPREVVEREVLFELQAFRDERLLRTLTEEQRCRLGENPVGRIIQMPTAELAVIGSITNGVGCRGTSGFTHGVTCKILTVVTT